MGLHTFDYIISSFVLPLVRLPKGVRVTVTVCISLTKVYNFLLLLFLKYPIFQHLEHTLCDKNAVMFCELLKRSVYSGNFLFSYFTNKLYHRVCSR